MEGYFSDSQNLKVNPKVAYNLSAKGERGRV